MDAKSIGLAHGDLPMTNDQKDEGGFALKHAAVSRLLFDI